MKCEKCIQEQKESRVFVPSGGFSTCMGWQDYYDEKGRFHSHDPNTHTSEWSCSNGHIWIVSKKALCPNCDYGKNSAEIRWIELPANIIK
jgi:hypothetical protein